MEIEYSKMLYIGTFSFVIGYSTSQALNSNLTKDFFKYLSQPNHACSTKINEDKTYKSLEKVQEKQKNSIEKKFKV